MGVQLAKNSIDLGIIVSNAEAALKFYRDTLGFEPAGEMPMPGGGTMYRLMCGESMIKVIELDKAPPAKAPPGGIQGAQPLSGRGSPHQHARHEDRNGGVSRRRGPLRLGAEPSHLCRRNPFGEGHPGGIRSRVRRNPGRDRRGRSFRRHAALPSRVHGRGARRRRRRAAVAIDPGQARPPATHRRDPGPPCQRHRPHGRSRRRHDLVPHVSARRPV
ncbi:MAG: VOC family protein [Proteobacteria bacterium]|nr:VOC family protein [Pseudomonadota bacterium]